MREPCKACSGHGVFREAGDLRLCRDCVDQAGYRPTDLLAAVMIDKHKESRRADLMTRQRDEARRAFDAEHVALGKARKTIDALEMDRDRLQRRLDAVASGLPDAQTILASLGATVGLAAAGLESGALESLICASIGLVAANRLHRLPDSTHLPKCHCAVCVIERSLVKLGQVPLLDRTTRNMRAALRKATP